MSPAGIHLASVDLTAHKAAQGLTLSLGPAKLGAEKQKRCRSELQTGALQHPDSVTAGRKIASHGLGSRGHGGRGREHRSAS